MAFKNWSPLILFCAWLLCGCSAGCRAEVDYADPSYRWVAEISPSGQNLLVRGENLDLIRDDPEGLIHALNGSDRDPESFRTPSGQEPLGTPKLKLLDQAEGTFSVEVINSPYLTQRMGSAGADAYLAEITFTLTEHPGTTAVQLLFEEGDHARPGTYTRDDFRDRWTAVDRK
jgi:hypothetical protein